MSTQKLLGLVFAALACAGPQEATREPSPSAPDPVPSTVDDTSPQTPPSTAPSKPPSTNTSVGQSGRRPAAANTNVEPLPLRAGSGGGYTPEGRAPQKSACAADTVRKKLHEVVGECKKASDKICGELKVRASEDGKSVRVTLDVTKQSFDDSFSRCVTSRMNAVDWQCSLPGSDVTLDLGCEL